jgi:hypothetical protein
MNFMFILLSEFFVVSKFDEINCNNIYGVFLMYFEMQIMVRWNNHEFGF